MPGCVASPCRAVPGGACHGALPPPAVPSLVAHARVRCLPLPCCPWWRMPGCVASPCRAAPGGEWQHTSRNAANRSTVSGRSIASMYRHPVQPSNTRPRESTPSNSCQACAALERKLVHKPGFLIGSCAWATALRSRLRHYTPGRPAAASPMRPPTCRGTVR
eukprot:361670-Chlamydomonas_euryale.AAC.9